MHVHVAENIYCYCTIIWADDRAIVLYVSWWILNNNIYTLNERIVLPATTDTKWTKRAHKNIIWWWFLANFECCRKEKDDIYEPNYTGNWNVNMNQIYLWTLVSVHTLYFFLSLSLAVWNSTAIIAVWLQNRPNFRLLFFFGWIVECAACFQPNFS